MRVAVSSSNFPRFSANPNTGQPLTGSAPPQVAMNTVVIGPNHLSYVTLPVVPLEALVPSTLGVVKGE